MKLAILVATGLIATGTVKLVTTNAINETNTAITNVVGEQENLRPGYHFDHVSDSFKYNGERYVSFDCSAMLNKLNYLRETGAKSAKARPLILRPDWIVNYTSFGDDHRIKAENPFYSVGAKDKLYKLFDASKNYDIKFKKVTAEIINTDSNKKHFEVIITYSVNGVEQNISLFSFATPENLYNIEINFYLEYSR